MAQEEGQELVEELVEAQAEVKAWVLAEAQAEEWVEVEWEAVVPAQGRAENVFVLNAELKWHTRPVNPVIASAVPNAAQS
ncbi:MAG: hypothetical protein WC169_03260 [Dehalococcoidia bacterium]